VNGRTKKRPIMWAEMVSSRLVFAGAEWGDYNYAGYRVRIFDQKGRAVVSGVQAGNLYNSDMQVLLRIPKSVHGWLRVVSDGPGHPTARVKVR
jgi:hypothetical protein